MFLYSSKDREKAEALTEEFMGLHASRLFVKESSEKPPFLKSATGRILIFSLYYLPLFPLAMANFMTFWYVVVDTLFHPSIAVSSFGFFGVASAVAFPLSSIMVGKYEWIHVWRYLSFFTLIVSLFALLSCEFDLMILVSVLTGFLMQILLKKPETNACAMIIRERAKFNRGLWGVLNSNSSQKKPKKALQRTTPKKALIEDRKNNRDKLKRKSEK